MSNRVIPAVYLKSVLQNGVGRYVCQLQRVTINFCKSSATSRGVRDFIENHLLEFTRKNPGIVVYLNPRRHHSPFVEFEYLNGRSEKLNIDRYPADHICQWLEQYRTRSGLQVARFRRHWHTDSPSIQGTWTPATNKDTSWNVAEFPCEDVSQRLPPKVTATERLLAMAKELREQEKLGASSTTSDKAAVQD